MVITPTPTTLTQSIGRMKMALRGGLMLTPKRSASSRAFSTATARRFTRGDIRERYNEQGITMHVNYFGSQFGCVQHWDGVDGEGSWYPLDNYDMNQWEVIGNIHEQSKS